MLPHPHSTSLPNGPAIEDCGCLNKAERLADLQPEPPPVGPGTEELLFWKSLVIEARGNANVWLRC